MKKGAEVEAVEGASEEGGQKGKAGSIYLQCQTAVPRGNIH